MRIDAPIKIADITFANRLMNGAYIGSKTLEDMEVLASSASGAIVVGSILVKARKPNKKGGYWLHKDSIYSLNSFGMPNGGYEYYKKALPKMVNLAHAKGKPLIANIAGFNGDEFVDLIGLCQNSGADMVELNLGCPNIWEGGRQERIISYHASLVGDILGQIKRKKLKAKIAVKISPLPPDILFEVAQEISKSGIVQVVTATNSYPNASQTTGTKKAGAKAENLAAFAGRALKPISLGVVRQLREQLYKDIEILGCGGVSSVNDVKDYLNAGARAVQLASALVDTGPFLFSEILKQN